VQWVDRQSNPPTPMRDEIKLRTVGIWVEGHDDTVDWRAALDRRTTHLRVLPMRGRGTAELRM